jgi:hypothetical protein
MMYEIHLLNEKLSIMDGYGWNDVIKVKSTNVDICDTKWISTLWVGVS